MENHQRTRLSSIVLAAVFLASIARAETPVQVGIHNGNMFFSETDFKVGQGSNDLELVRTYNNRSLHRGIFGFGFSTFLETYFELTPEGNVWVHELGGGDTVLINRVNFQPKDLDRVVDDMIEKIKAQGQFSGRAEDFWAQRRETLKTDLEVRIKTARDLKITYPNDGLSKMRWETTSKGQQSMFVKGPHWVRKRGQSGEEYFKYDAKTQKGWIVGVSDGQGRTIRYVRDDQNRVVEVVNFDKKSYRIKYNQVGTVSTIELPDGKKVVYEYKSFKGDVTALVNVRRPGGQNSEYEYTSGMYVGDYNIKTFIEGNRKTTMTYDMKKDTIAQINLPDGTNQFYEYFTADSNPLENYGTKVKYVKDGKTIAESGFEYWWKVRKDGTRYLYKTEQLEAGVKTQTVYSECCGLPLNIIRNGKTTTFKYTPEGLLISKVKPDGETVDLEYNQAYKKVSKVVYRVPGQSKPKVINYTFDGKGNLATANSSDGHAIKLSWDKKGRMKTLSDKLVGTLEFSFDRFDRNQKIKFKGPSGSGEINLDYGSEGHVRKVSSNKGPQVAYQVTNAFQELLVLIGAAAVPLTAD